MNIFSMDGRHVLVTGANRGLGQAIASALSELGAVVYGTSRTERGAHQIEAETGRPGFVLDIENEDSIDNLMSSLPEAVDVLVNNAGVNYPAPAVDVTEQQWDAVMSTNLKGTFFLTQAVARRWIGRGNPGVIVNIGSQAGTVGIEERAAYCASKGGLDQLTKVLAIEWAQHGIRVNTVAPTFVRTELTESTLSRPGWGQTLLSRIPVGRFGEPEDIVGAVAFLAGGAARMITGHTLLVDGGYTAQ
ncbi:SDR family NAD(P)-dependent oxidoreductase [Rhodococcoides yunnanense]|uniref:SDR family oxidoreductase n=1 Tax=Rhodococcoides yunnanense TaxID=278209 RepID=A0ABU4BK48_9NOCA|nr:SDR family oxidoreductase [Rhodococcus yunnanensis]MDV6264592.1 SDR family oxidoreductase [Rhodococcus yunnanensis]